MAKTVEPLQEERLPIEFADVRGALLENSSGIANEITAKMLDAESIDELLGTTEPTLALVGTIFALRQWKWLQSTKPGGSGYFAVLEVTDLGGNERVITTGSQNILAALVWFQEHKIKDIPPLTVKMSETADGNTVYRFAKAAAA